METATLVAPPLGPAVPAAGPAPAFPLAALPRPLADYAENVAAALACPVDLVAVAALATAAAAIGNSRTLEVKPGWLEAPRLWCAILADSGSKKSPALAAAFRPIREAQRRDYEAWATPASAEPGAGRPRLRQRYTTDTTREGLVRLLQDNPRGIALVADELAAWALNLTQRGRGDERPFWLSLWNGAEIVVHRAHERGRPAAYVPEPILNLVGCLPPATLPRLADEVSQEDGLLARLLFCWPEPVRHGWTEAVPDPRIVAAYDALFARLLALERAPGPGDPSSRLGWTRAGRAAWIDWEHTLGRDLNDPAFAAQLRATWAKLESYAARLALIVHVCRQVMAETAEPGVDAVSMTAAAQLVAYFQAQARRVYARLGILPQGGSPDSQAVLGWIRRHQDALRRSPRFRWSQLRHDLHNRFAGRDEALRQALGQLVQGGLLQEVPRETPRRGRPPEASYVVSLALLDR